jgi:hypothetical protein
MTSPTGYRSPPTSGQFKKGVSGNPKGRPKGSRNFTTLLEKELGQTIVVTENGRRRSVSRLQAIVKRVVAGALQGDKKALVTMVDILRRTGGMDAAEVDGLLPDNYQSLLDAYVATRAKSINVESTSTGGSDE